MPVTANHIVSGTWEQREYASSMMASFGFHHAHALARAWSPLNA